MCTATFWPSAKGYRVAMNRDEQRLRPLALPPAMHRTSDGIAWHPLENGGGTWISLNDAGVTFFLVNWYTVPSHLAPGATTRGAIIQSLCQSRSLQTTQPNPALSTRPFRLVGVYPRTRQIREWRWNQQQLATLDHPWEPRQWISSGRDEPGAQRIRNAVFAARAHDSGAGSSMWLQALHASHDPEPGPYSHCVHRPDAVSVSYTEIEVLPDTASISYYAGSPCAPTAKHGHTLARVIESPPDK